MVKGSGAIIGANENQRSATWAMVDDDDRHATQPSADPSTALSRACVLRLASSLLGRPRRGVVGSSRYATTLREMVRQAAADPKRRAVLIRGEQGLEKDNLVALIHFGSPARQQLLARVDAALLHDDGDALFEPDAEGLTLLDCLGNGALLIDQIDRAPEAIRPQLLELVRSGRWWRPNGREEHFEGRLFLTAETCQRDLDCLTTQIRVPPLRVRRQDLGEWMRYGVRQRAAGLGWRQPPRVPETVVKTLQGYDFPGNLRELSTVVDRALLQSAANHPATLTEEVFWTGGRPSARPRFDLWRWKPWLRQRMRSPRLWNTLLFGLVSWIFVAVNAWLWLGPQERGANGALLLFWAWWWPLILLAYPLVGRLWCSFCPFMVWGEIIQRLAMALGFQPARWPRGNHDRWAAPALAAGFGLILIWEEVWGLENDGRLSSALLLLITGGAVLGSLLFEQRFWCRYLCPVGGMNGLFAKLAISELRAQVGTCSGSCSSYGCFKGGAAIGEGLATAGCPLGTHPAHLSDNRNCVLCMTCAAACPHRSVQLRLRPPAADLQRDMQPPAGEAGLILVLAGGVCLHSWRKILGWLPLAPDSLQSGALLARLAFAGLALALPAAIWLLARAVASLTTEHRSAQWHVLYGLLPLLWALLLARHLPLGLLEAGEILPVSLAPWPELARGLPGWSADPHVLGFCQSVVLIAGGIGSLVILRRLLQPSRRVQIVWFGLVLLLTATGRWLVELSG
ncbi:MAG: 4Fe-4S binding protein [Cyanobacteriota bacterium]|nr:4Fe-4S binding protein [Cyanobacteriota bacterium]